MKNTLSARAIAIGCAAVLATAALSGCESPATGATDDQQKNRTYMTEVNVAMEDIGNRLESFDEAVGRGDVVTMRTQADNAFKAIDVLADIDTPDAMKDLQDGYTEGCEKLKDALGSYVDLYTEIDSATEEHPFDYATYDERLKDIQDTYNEGIDKLKAADEEALKLNED